MISLKNFKKIFYIIFSGKIKLNKIKKKKILIFDKMTLRESYKFFKLSQYTFLHTRHEEYNFFVIMNMLTKFKFSKKSYVESYIRLVDPKIVISSNEHDTIFYKLKKIFPNVNFCMVQNGSRSKNFDNFDNLKKNKGNFEIDYFFVFNRYLAKEYKKFIKFKTCITGSLKNNCFKIKNERKFKNSLLFISQFKFSGFDINKNSITKKLYPTNDKSFWIENIILPYIEDYCKKNNYKFSILGRYDKSEKYSFYEKNYFKRLLNHKFKFYSKDKYNYKIIDKYDTILAINSTLGHEALSRKRKVIYICGRKVNNKLVTEFLWPKKNPKRGNFFTHSIDRKSIEKVLKNNLPLNYKEWFKKNQHYIKDYMPFDYKNKIFKNKIKQILRRS